MDRLDELRRVRLEKLAKLRELGEDPYPHSFHRTHGALEILDRFAELEEKERVAIAGRIVSLRDMGKASFAHLQDASGRIQVYLRQDDLPDGALRAPEALRPGGLRRHRGGPVPHPDRRDLGARRFPPILARGSSPCRS